MDIRRTEGSFALAGDRGLFRRAWLSREPERVFVIAHGFAEHSGRYEALGTWFAERACAVHAYDQRGHGRSDGSRNYVNSFADYQDDLAAVLELVPHTEFDRLGIAWTASGPYEIVQECLPCAA